MTSVRVREEWRARIAAEYTSAAVTQHLVLWLIQAGAPPDLIDAGLAIVNDELVHSRLSHEVYVAAGGTEPPAIVREQLGLTRTAQQLEIDILRIAVRVFCLGETVAVPLFKHLRERCVEPVAKKALDRILRDEVRHRDFGWDLLDWLLSTPMGEEIPAMVARVPMLHTTSAPIAEIQGTATNASSIIYGDFSQMFIGVREVITIQMLHELYASEGAIGLAVHARMDVQLAHKESFSRLKGIKP